MQLIPYFSHNYDSIYCIVVLVSGVGKGKRTKTTQSFLFCVHASLLNPPFLLLSLLHLTADLLLRENEQGMLMLDLFPFCLVFTRWTRWSQL